MEYVTKPASILVVDDSPDMIHLLSKLLTDRGHQVRATKDSTLAVQIAESAPPDLFLLDVDMPEMDGYELCAALKASEILKNIPVIFVSAHDTTINKTQAFATGGVDYISKSVHAEELASRVNNHVALYRLQQQLQQQVDEQTRVLKETLTALRVLMNQQKQEARETEKTILTNINTLVMPFVERLKKLGLDENQLDIVNILDTNLQKIATPLIDNRDLLQLKLSPVQIQIANFIKDGKQTKEIASILNLSELTISTHRKNMRKKLDISNRKLSLHAYLSAL